MSNPVFPEGLGTPFIQSDTDLKVNNPTSTKQPLNQSTGLLVLASDQNSRYYLHNYLSLSGSGAPSISSFSPSSGIIGTEVTINGSNFTGVISVNFNGLSVASFIVVSSTRIRANVPSGATTGKISVTTSGGTALSAGDFTVTLPPSAQNDALSFDGVDDRAIILDTPLLSGGPGKSITVEAWVNMQDVSAEHNPIVAKYYNGAYKDWGLDIESGMLNVNIESTDEWSCQAGLVPVGQWTHLAFTFDNAADVVRLYVNGFEAGAGFELTKDMPDTDADIWLGAHSYDSAYRTFGIVDEVRIWNYARSLAELQSAMNLVLTGAEPGLIGYWPFDEGSGQLAADLTGNGNHASLGAGAGADSGDPAWVTSVDRSTLPMPTIAAFTPTSGEEDMDVTITGANFNGATEVAFNGIAATSLIVDSDTQIRTTVPIGATTGRIRVTNAYGFGFSAADFTVIPSPGTFTFTPQHDTYARSSNPTSTNGAAGTLRLEQGAFSSYLKFDVTGLNAAVQLAKLRLYVLNASIDGGSAHAVSNNLADNTTPWTEGNLSLENAPAMNSPALSTLGPVSVSTLVEYNVTAAITGNGIYSFGLTNNSTDRADYSSKEGTVAPVLVIKTILNPPTGLQLVSPNGGESWPAASSQNITWSSTGGLGNVKLEYSIDNGGNWTVITSSTANDGSQNWTVPNSPTSQALVRISDASDNDPQDVSNGFFSITSPSANHYALQFDSVDDYVEISDNALLSGGAGKSLTVEAWVKPSIVSGTRPIVHKFLDGNTKDWGFAIFDGTVEAGIESSADNWEVSGGSVAAGVWTHLAFVFDNNANLARLFVNGVQATQKTLSKDMPDSNAPIRIGRHGYDSDYFSGEIEEVRVWNTARSASQITAAMNGELLGNESGLIGYWAFNQGSGQTAEDGTSNNNDGRLGNATSSDAADPAWVSSTAPFVPVPSTLTLSSPNGGESWEVGSVHAITWSSQGSIANVKLEYSTNNGASWTTIVASTSNDGNYSWTIPNAASSQCLARISDASDGDPSDMSNNVFSIVDPPPPTVTLTSPNGGENWTVGNNQNITWSSTGTLGNVKLEYSTNNGASWTTIVASTANDGNHSWTIPDAVSNQSLVRVSDAADGDPSDVSNGVFAIVTSSSVPVITSFIPTSGPSNSEVTITGSLFTGTTAVQFNGVSVASFILDSDTQIRVIVPAGATTGKISVATTGGTALSADDFTVTASPLLPTISSFTPSSGAVGAEVTINGVNFVNVTAVKFDAALASAFIVDSDTQIRATVPSGATTGKISVSTAGGTAFSLTDFSVTSSGTPATLTFTPLHDAYVRFSTPTSNFGNAVTLRARVPAGDTLRAFVKFEVSGISGAVLSAKLRLYVNNASNDGGAVHLVSNNYRNDTAPWEEGGLNWNTAPALDGAAFSSAGAVVLDTWVELDVTAAIAGNGTYSFGIKNASTDDVHYSSAEGANKPELVIQLSGTPPPAPSISSFTPANGPANTEVTILGSNFIGSANVAFNGTPASVVTVDSETQLRANAPAGATTGKISVATAGGTAVSSDDFTVMVLPPSISGFTPTSGAVGSEVTITGADLNGATAINFNNTVAPTFTVDSATQIRANVPSGATTGKISVTTAGGTALSTDDFTVTAPPPAPTISSFTPTSGAVSTQITISGNNFTGAMGVQFNNVSAASFTVNSATEILANVPTGATTGKISVTTAGGTALSVDDFTVTVPPAAPEISSFSPTSGPVGTQVTINGANFTGASSVKFNNTSASTFIVDSATQLRANVPTGAITGKISVTTAEGTALSANDFIVTTAAPIISSFLPASGEVGVEVTITGNHFTGATSVQFNGSPASTFIVDSAIQIRATVPGAATTGKISVSTAGGTAFSLTDFSVTSGGTPATLTFTPLYDAYVRFSTPTSNYGATTTLRLRKNSSEDLDTYLKFDVTGITGAVQSAKLRFSVVNASVDGGSIYAVSNFYKDTTTPWTQTGINWNNAPGMSGAALSSPGAVVVGVLAEYDVTAAVTGNGLISFGLSNNSNDDVHFSSQEGATKPELIIQTGSGGPPPPAPSISSFSPSSGAVEVQVTITGANFSGATSVQFNGTPSVGFIVDSATQIRANVPTGATSGKLSVTTAGGTALSANDFTVMATPSAPTITSFTPSSGAVGLQVTITGTNFTGATSVKFNGISATGFTINSATQIRANVPTGATSGKISVTTPNGTATSAADFTVTGGGTTTLTFDPRYDAYVKLSTPTANYGTATTLRLRKTSSEDINCYLKFEVTGVTGSVVSAKLRLKVTNASNDGGSVYSVSNTYNGSSTAWTENGIHWNNAPSLSGAPLSSVGSVSTSSFAEFNVTAAISGNGNYSFGLTNNSSDEVYYSSQEGANHPELIIEMSSLSTARQSDVADAVASGEAALPKEYTLSQNYPNPFNGQTMIEYALPEAGQVSLMIYNALGQRVRILVDETQPAGYQRAAWDGRDEHGANVGSGIYFYQLEAGRQRLSGRMMLQQ
jgi:hypothetical protein